MSLLSILNIRKKVSGLVKAVKSYAEPLHAKLYLFIRNPVSRASKILFILGLATVPNLAHAATLGDMFTTFMESISQIQKGVPALCYLIAFITIGSSLALMVAKNKKGDHASVGWVGCGLIFMIGAVFAAIPSLITGGAETVGQDAVQS